jgi:hypothetical protein
MKPCIYLYDITTYHIMHLYNNLDKLCLAQLFYTYIILKWCARVCQYPLEVIKSVLFGNPIVDARTMSRVAATSLYAKIKCKIAAPFLKVIIRLNTTITNPAVSS